MSGTWTPETVRVAAEALARRHAAEGRKVVGYLTPCVPDELIEAAGLCPIMLRAGPETSTRLGDRYMEDLFDTVTRGVFERLLKGDFDYLSAIVLPRANDSAHRLYYYLSELQRTGGAKLPPVLLSDIAATPDAASLRYSIDATNRLWSELRTIGNSSNLRPAIEASNRRTRLLTDIAARRRAQPIPGVSALTAFATARLAPDLLNETCASQAVLAPRSGPRVIICGSPHDGADLHQLVEEAGGQVVGDYHAAGELSIGDEMGPGDPIEAIVHRYRSLRAASRAFTRPGPEVAAFAKACNAQAAIFSYFPEEEALTWDFPEQKVALTKIGVRVARLADQTRPFDAAANREAVTALIAGGGA